MTRPIYVLDYPESYSSPKLCEEKKANTQVSTCFRGTSLSHCHMCDLDVPTAYIQGHNESRTHKTNVAICQESLRRLTAHATNVTTNDPSSNPENGHSYFCPICSEIVQDKYDDVGVRHNHEDSQLHHESELKVQLLEEFHKFYIDSSNLNEMFYPILDVLFNFDVNEEKAEAEIAIDDKINNSETAEADNIEIHNTTADTATQAECVEIINFTVQNNDLNKKRIEETIGGKEKSSAKVKAPIENWRNNDNGITEVDGSKNNDVTAQANSVYEINNVTVQNNDTKQSSKNRTEETISDKGKRRGKVRPPIENWRNNDNGITGVTSSKDDKKLNDSNDSKHYLMQKTNNPFKLNCRICNNSVADKTSSVETHLNSKAHITQYEEFMIKNRLEERNGRLYCLVCDSYILPKYEIVHVNSTRHKQKLQKHVEDNEEKGAP